MQFASTEWGCQVVVIPELGAGVCLPRACTPHVLHARLSAGGSTVAETGFSAMLMVGKIWESKDCI